MNSQEVIKGLECLDKEMNMFSECYKDCPYVVAGDGRNYCSSLTIINDAIALLKESEPVKHGEWVLDAEQNHVEYTYHCSVCGYGIWGEDEMSDYCGGCGAKMGGKNDD